MINLPSPLRTTGNIIIVLLLSVACQKDIKSPIGRFQKSTSAAITAISGYYNELNAYERNLYLQGLAIDATQQLAVKDQNGKPTPLLHDSFSATGIQARLALLQQLGNYAERLTTLAGNSSPEKFQTSVTALASSLTALQGTFTSLSLTSGTNAAQYVGPISTLASVIGGLVTQKKQQDAVKQAIIDGEKPITDLLNFLEQDLEKYVSATRLTGTLQSLSDQVIQYNSERGSLTQAQRQNRLNDIAKLVQEYQLLCQVRPSEVVQQMQISHQALVKAIKSGNPLSIALVLGAIDDYEATVERLLTATHALEELISK